MKKLRKYDWRLTIFEHTHKSLHIMCTLLTDCFFFLNFEPLNLNDQSIYVYIRFCKQFKSDNVIPNTLIIRRS